MTRARWRGGDRRHRGRSRPYAAARRQGGSRALAIVGQETGGAEAAERIDSRLLHRITTLVDRAAHRNNEPVPPPRPATTPSAR